MTTEPMDLFNGELAPVACPAVPVPRPTPPQHPDKRMRGRTRMTHLVARLTDRAKTAALVCCYPCGRVAWIWQHCEHGPFAVLAVADLLGRLNWRWQAFRHRRVTPVTRAGRPGVDSTRSTPWLGELLPPPDPLWWAEIDAAGALTWGRIGDMWTPTAALWRNFYAADETQAELKALHWAAETRSGGR